MTETAATAVADDRILRIERVLDAPRALVFKLWTRPEHLSRWLGPHGFTATCCEVDPRPGGRYRACIRSSDGVDHWMHGVYREVVAPERLVFTFAWGDSAGATGHETLVTVALAEAGQGTVMTFEQAVFETAELCQSHRGGWSESFERLAAYLARV